MKRIFINNFLTVFLFFLATVFLLLSGCGKECKGPDENLGLIIKEHDFGDCFSSSGLEGEYIITDDSSYQAIDNLFTSKPECKNNPQKNPIDFSKYSLLGKEITGGHTIKLIRKVVLDKNNSRYIYTIEIIECMGWYHSIS